MVTTANQTRSFNISSTPVFLPLFIYSFLYSFNLSFIHLILLLIIYSFFYLLLPLFISSSNYFFTSFPPVFSPFFSLKFLQAPSLSLSTTHYTQPYCPDLTKGKTDNVSPNKPKIGRKSARDPSAAVIGFSVIFTRIK